MKEKKDKIKKAKDAAKSTAKNKTASKATNNVASKATIKPTTKPTVVPQSKSKPAEKSEEPKKNMLTVAAEKKAADLASGNKIGILGKDLSSRFFSSRAGNSQRPAKRRGRNGQGKP